MNDFESIAYKAKIATRAAAMSPPKLLVLLMALPVNGTEAEVVAAGGTLVAPATPETTLVLLDGAEVVYPAAWEAATVPGIRATLAVADPTAGAVEKATCGTVIAVTIVVVVDEDGMTDPEREPVDSVHGTTKVVLRVTVVTGVEATPWTDEVATALEAAGT